MRKFFPFFMGIGDFMAGFFIRIFLLFILMSCSIKKAVLRKMTPFFAESSQLMMKEKSWHFFKNSAPTQLKMMELIYEQEPLNTELLPILARNFSGYAFIVFETLYLEDQFLGVEESSSKKEALYFYDKAFQYGLTYLERQGLTRKDLLSHDLEQLKKKLTHLTKDHAPGILYTAQSWGSLIQLQQDNIFLVSHLSKVKMLFDRACELTPHLDGQICDLFSAQYESSRPSILGGRPQLGKKLFLEAINKYPQNLLLQVEYLRQVVIPAQDKETFVHVMTQLEMKFSEFQKGAGLSSLMSSSLSSEDVTHLLNATAEQRARLMKKYQDTIFN